MSEDEKMPTIAQRLFDAGEAESEMDEALEQAGVPHEGIRWDSYDCSIELDGIPSDYRLSIEAQRAIHAAGFVTAYVNHKDGWETHYRWDHREPFKISRGWRRWMQHDKEPGPSGVIGFSVMKISYWPEGWKGSLLEGDLAAGKIEIVPDPLEISIDTPPVDGIEATANKWN